MIPTYEEVQAALGRLKPARLGRLWHIASVVVWWFHQLVRLFEMVWKDRHVVRDWHDALIVPVPKKGNLKLCDNWRGISLLNVVEKVLGRIVQDKAEDGSRKCFAWVTVWVQSW